MDLKPIPSFYCCYLLRSKVNHSKLYVGSTPNPRRRLDQHNGITKGGAVRTGFRDGMWRPWEMSLIVTGFPSNIAALQFEWAWQNSHLTRKISDDQRISIQRTVNKWSRKRQKIIKRTAKLPVSLKDKLANLHLLLRVPSFARWPLQLRFFRKDIYDNWILGTADSGERLRDGILIVQDFENGTEAADTSLFKQARISELDVTFASLKERVEKTLFLKESSQLNCACCTKQLNVLTENILVCPKKTCYSISHLACLSERFLEGSDDLVPTEGNCPKCQTSTRWSDLVQESTLLTRDEKAVAQLLKPKRRRAGITSSQTTAVAEDEDLGPDEDEGDSLNLENIVDEPSFHEGDKWDRLYDSSEDRSQGMASSEGSGQNMPTRIPSVVIQDSDDSDDWKILD